LAHEGSISKQTLTSHTIITEEGDMRSVAIRTDAHRNVGTDSIQGRRIIECLAGKKMEFTLSDAQMSTAENDTSLTNKLSILERAIFLTET
jgi:hypothetical protein